MPDSLQLYSISPAIKKWLSLSSAFYIIVVLNFFEPFAIKLQGFNPVYHLTLSTYGLVTGAVTWMLLSFVFPFCWRHLGQKVFGCQVFWWGMLVLLLSISNWAYSLLFHYTLSGWQNMYVPLRGFFELMPQFFVMFAAWGVLSWGNVILLQRHKPIQPPEKSTQFLSLYSENQSDRFRIEAKAIICFQTCDNYLQLYYLNESGSLSKRLIRSSMKKMVAQLALYNVEFFRCHQSYLVNPDYIKGVHKSPQQATLEVAWLDFPVLLSRKNMKASLAMLAQSTESP
ncbi:LytTR family DNA-binding domain-containing protein [Planctobacterium marinum]|uniref:HTH LytTR-type domain-containing protein n=1 Tax=Planctobacterium marinum TaxID=1631968 RepID=A0AA48HMP3_9ALTE|nr:hypothetical protein MACH26_18580 [Planctobacterium marinum]